MRTSTLRILIIYNNNVFSGVSMDKEVHLYKDACTKAVEYPYLKHSVNKSINDIHFVPFEDIMGISHSAGFSSILAPGEKSSNFILK